MSFPSLYIWNLHLGCSAVQNKMSQKDALLVISLNLRHPAKSPARDQFSLNTFNDRQLSVTEIYPFP